MSSSSATLQSPLSAQTSLGRVLIVEDDMRLAESLKKSLGYEGYDVEIAAGGSQGIASLLQNPPSLILCDIKMPDVDGYSLLRRVRNNPKFQQIPFIFLSGRSHLDELRLGMECGADDYLIKPVSPKVLLRAVEVRLERARQQRSVIKQASESLNNVLMARLPHELLTPLNGILGFVELLDGEEGLSGQAREMLGDIRSAASRLERFFKKYILFAQIQIERQDPRWSCRYKRGKDMFTIASFQKKALRIAGSFGRGDDLVLDIKSDAVPVDDHLLDCLLGEVLENAFLYSPDNTPVELFLGQDEKSFTVRVSNKGTGFTSSEIESIGMPFMRFDRQDCPYNGLGLGLYIAREVCERQKATLRVQNCDGGCSLECVFPLA